jgi:hypothetical protein
MSHFHPIAQHREDVIGQSRLVPKIEALVYGVTSRHLVRDFYGFQQRRIGAVQRE